jgi:hypothetical protein
MSQLKVFLSYSLKDKRVAGDYKKHLETYYGFQVFVAHDDLTPACEWNNEIIDNIRLSDIFVVLISKNSEQSVFVNQEIGIALGLKTRIFPIKIHSTNPFGFIEKIQGFPYIKSEAAVISNGSKLFSILTSGREEFSLFGEIAMESIIHALSQSLNFNCSNIIIGTLIESESQLGFSSKHVELLISVCNNNNQVYGGAYKYSSLKKLLEKKYKVHNIR